MYLGARRRASQGARVWRGAWVPPLGQAAAVGVACWPRCRAWRFSKLHCGSGLSATMSGLEIQQTPLWEWPIGHDVELGDSANSIVGVAYRPRCRAGKFSKLHCGSGLSATMPSLEIQQGIAPGRALPQVGPSGLRVRHRLHCGSGLSATMSGWEIQQGIAPGRALPQVGRSD